MPFVGVDGHPSGATLPIDATDTQPTGSPAASYRRRMASSTAMKSPWRNRDLVLVLVGGTVNNVGDWMLAVALPVYVYVETKSGLATAAVFLIELVVGVGLGPIGGSVADRWNLRATLVVTNALQAVALLPLLAVTPSRLWPVFVVAALQALIQQVNDPASFALVPRLVVDEQLVRVNAALSSGGSLARLIGAPLGGIAVATRGLGAVVVADAATFAIGALSAWLIRSAAVRRSAVRLDGSEQADPSVRAGLRLVRASSQLGAMLGVQGVVHLAFGAFSVVFVAFVADYLHGGGTEVGVIRGSAAFGGIVSGLVIARFAHRWDAPLVMVAGYALFFVIGLGFVNAPSFTTTLWIYVVLFALSGFPNVTSQVGTSATLQQLAPREALGRLSGLSGAVAALGSGIGSIGTGALLELTTARVLFNAQTSCMAVCAVIGYVGVLRPRRRALAAAAA
jgi:MFS family permease